MQMEDFRQSLEKLNKIKFPVSLIFEWVKSGEMSLDEFENYLFRLERTWL